MQGKLPEDILDVKTARRLREDCLLTLGRLAFGYTRVGLNEDARAILRQLLKFQAHGWQGSLQIALIHHGLGDEEAVLKWLEQAAEDRQKTSASYGMLSR